MGDFKDHIHLFNREIRASHGWKKDTLIAMTMYRREKLNPSLQATEVEIFITPHRLIATGWDDDLRRTSKKKRCVLFGLFIGLVLSFFDLRSDARMLWMLIAPRPAMAPVTRPARLSL